MKPVAVVEAEKTAVLASIFIDSFIWLAVGGKSYLKAEKLSRFGHRKIILYPDADGFDLWRREAVEANKLGLNVTVSETIERAATEEEKKNGFDLADYLIRGELEIQKWNAYADAFNAKVERIRTDKETQERFLEICAEFEAIADIEPDTIADEQIRTIIERCF